MSTYKKVDPSTRISREDELAELNRRSNLNGNEAYLRGLSLAEQTEHRNVKSAFDTALAGLRRATLRRDTTQAGRDCYERSYTNARNAAARLATLTGSAVGIPEYLPPKDDGVVMVEVAPHDPGTYRETKGLSPDGKGLPGPAIPGSAADTEWLK